MSLQEEGTEFTEHSMCLRVVRKSTLVEDAHTGIRGVIATHGNVDAVYDLSGARIVNAEKHRGIVIRGRKKYLDGIGR